MARLSGKVLDAIAGYDGVAALESFDPAVVLQCRAAGCTQPIGLVGPLTTAGGDVMVAAAAAVAASDFLSWDIAHLEAADELGRPLTTWTVRDETSARPRAAPFGADRLRGFPAGLSLC